MPLEYAFGLGNAGQTYVYEHDGKMYESHVSFYDALNGLDLTIGAQNHKPQNLEEAAGRLMVRQEAGDCFGCHTTSANPDGFRHPAELTPGVTCEHCHGSALAHVEGFKTGKPVLMKSLSKLSTEETGRFLRAMPSHLGANCDGWAARYQQSPLPTLSTGQQQMLRSFRQANRLHGLSQRSRGCGDFRFIIRSEVFGLPCDGQTSGG